MNIIKISLTDFRNYSQEHFELSPGTNVFFGDNAQGKTNLLEAVYYLTGAKSFRGVRDRDLIRKGAEQAEILAQISAPHLEYSIGARFSVSGRKRLEINGVRISSSSDLSGRLHAVLFSPEDLNLVKEGSAVRRRFMDLAFSQLRPRYAEAVAQYKKLQDHKMRILRDWREKPSLLQALPTFNTQLAQAGAVIIGYRAQFLDKIKLYATQIHSEISGKREHLSLVYKTVSTVVNPFAPASELIQALEQHAGTHREAELASGSVLSGPHKDDLEIYSDGVPARIYASQGQMRTAALSMKLAERQLFRDDTGEYPILLLDDVLSELDAQRRDYILNRMDEGQVLITLCDERELGSFSGKKFRIFSGRSVLH